MCCACALCALDMSVSVCLCALGCVLVFALRRRRACVWWQNSCCSKFPPAEGMLLGILHKWLRLQRSGIAPVKWHSSRREAEDTAWMLNWPPSAGKAARLRACKSRSCLQAAAELIVKRFVQHAVRHRKGGNGNPVAVRPLKNPKISRCAANPDHALVLVTLVCVCRLIEGS